MHKIPYTLDPLSNDFKENKWKEQNPSIVHCDFLRWTSVIINE